MAFSATYWNALGVSRSKIMVGIPTYSHSFWLVNKNWHYPGSPAKSEGPEFSYGEVCDFLNQPGSVRVFDEAASVPYAYNSTLWITYEDEVSAAKKAEWIRDNGFGGSMTYNINNDDMDGRCRPNGQPFALHRLIRSLLP
jgi:chitinase